MNTPVYDEIMIELARQEHAALQMKQLKDTDAEQARRTLVQAN